LLLAQEGFLELLQQQQEHRPLAQEDLLLGQEGQQYIPLVILILSQEGQHPL